MRLEAGPHRGQVVVRQGQGEVGNCRRHARRIRDTKRQRSAAGLDQKTVGVPVVAAFEFDDRMPAGRGPREAHGAHGRLGSGIDHAHHLQSRHDGAQALGHLDLCRARRPETETLGGGFLHRRYDGRMGMPGNHRAPGADIVDVGASFHVVQASAFGTLEEDRVAADTVECAYRGIHAPGYTPAGSRDEFGAALHRRIVTVYCGSRSWHTTLFFGRELVTRD